MSCTLGFISNEGKYFQHCLSDKRFLMYKQPGEQLNLINNNPLTNLLFLLNQSLQQINPSLQIINPIPIKIFLNMLNSFRTIKSNISQTTKNINNASIYLSIYILLEHLLK